MQVNHLPSNKDPRVRYASPALHEHQARAFRCAQLPELPAQGRVCVSSFGRLQEPHQLLPYVLACEVFPDLAGKVCAVVRLAIVPPGEEGIKPGHRNPREILRTSIHSSLGSGSHYKNPRSIGNRSSRYNSPVLLMFREGALAVKVEPSRLKAKDSTSRMTGPNNGRVRSSDL